MSLDQIASDVKDNLSDSELNPGRLVKLQANPESSRDVLKNVSESEISPDRLVELQADLESPRDVLKNVPLDQIASDVKDYVSDSILNRDRLLRFQADLMSLKNVLQNMPLNQIASDVDDYLSESEINPDRLVEPQVDLESPRDVLKNVSLDEMANNIKDCYLSDSEPIPDRLVELQSDLQSPADFLRNVSMDQIVNDVKDGYLSDSEPTPDRLVELQADLEMLYKEFDIDKVEEMIKNHIDKTLQSKNPFKIVDFGIGIAWYNTSRCLSLDADLRNRVLVLDFFTYCCINCLHILPTLRYIEDKYSVNQGLAVIGIHSPKFPTEGDKKCVKEAIIRHDIQHPVVNDTSYYLWHKLCIKYWPTVLIIGPEGHVLFALTGETDIESKLHVLCREVLAYFEDHNYPLDKSDLPISLLKDTVPSCGLLYPSNICTNEKSDTIIISDTGHNRVIIVSKSGQLLNIVGRGVQDYIDGTFEEAAFDSPRGLAWREPHFVFVADTGNHCVRRLDLQEKCVTTATSALRKKAAGATKETIYTEDKMYLSPYDLCFGPNVGDIKKDECGKLNSLYIACTGSHQIWVLFFENFIDTSRQIRHECKAEICELFAGNGKEECRNNTYRLLSSFAQPSGISFSKNCVQSLFVADSESSAIRSVSMADGSVKTVAGGPLDPTDLFEFGDEDGKGRRAKFQHPMGIAVLDKDNIFVADTYNHKIKVVRSKDKFIFNKTKTFAGRGSHGNTISKDLLQCEFNEPTGLCISNDLRTLYIVDTNNHCIKMVDLVSNTLSLFQIQGLLPTNSKPINIVNYLSATDQICEQSTTKDPVKISVIPGGKIRCYFSIESDPHIVLTEDDRQPWKIAISGKPLLINCQSNVLFDQRYQPSLILEDETHENSEDETHEKIEDETREKIEDETHEKMEDETHEKMEDETHEKMADETHEKMGDETHEKMGDETHEKMEDETHEKMEDETHEKIADETHEKMEDETHEKMEDETHENMADQTHEKKGDETHEKMGDETHENMGDETHEKMGDETHEKMGDETHEKLGDEIHEKLGDETHEKMGHETHEKMGDETHEKMGDETHEKMGDETHEKMEDETHEMIADETHEKIADETHEKIGGEAHEKIKMTDETHEKMRDETHEKMESRVNLEMTLNFCDKKNVCCFSRKTNFKFVVDMTDQTSKDVESITLLCIVK